MTTLVFDQEVPVIAIRALGGFRVFRDGRPVPLREWQSKKPRELLKLLAARRGRPVPRECLLEALWPGEDPRRTRPRLSVALSTLRAVLDPGRRFDADHFVMGTPDVIALETAHVQLDLERFVAAAEEALTLVRRGHARAAIGPLEAAEAAYGGDFLEDVLYEEWAFGPREEARALYIEVLRALVELSAASGDHAAASRYALRILERDPHDEHAHLALVHARTVGGAHGEARRAYGHYVARMDEIGVEPAPFPDVMRRRSDAA